MLVNGHPTQSPYVCARTGPEVELHWGEMCQGEGGAVVTVGEEEPLTATKNALVYTTCSMDLALPEKAERRPEGGQRWRQWDTPGLCCQRPSTPPEGMHMAKLHCPGNWFGHTQFCRRSLKDAAHCGGCLWSASSNT